MSPPHVHLRSLGIELLSLRWPALGDSCLWAPDASVLVGAPGTQHLCWQPLGMADPALVQAATAHAPPAQHCCTAEQP